jgi:hypothetical protein
MPSFLLPIASNSSINTIQPYGQFLALLNIYLIFLGPTPTYIYSNYDAQVCKKGKPA